MHLNTPPPPKKGKKKKVSPTPYLNQNNFIMSEVKPSCSQDLTMPEDRPPDPNLEDSAQQQDVSTAKFHVDKTLIPSAHLAEMNEDKELEELGLTVFNQEEFEEGILC